MCKSILVYPFPLEGSSRYFFLLVLNSIAFNTILMKGRYIMLQMFSVCGCDTLAPLAAEVRTEEVSVVPDTVCAS